MVVLINLMMFGAALVPFVAGVLGWKYLTHPAKMYRREAKGLARDTQKALRSNSPSEAWTLAQLGTALARSVDPDASEIRLPELGDLYDALAEADRLKSEAELREERP